MTRIKIDLSVFLQGTIRAMDFAASPRLLELIMEADAGSLMGAGRHERDGHRTTWRNGYRGPLP